MRRSGVGKDQERAAGVLAGDFGDQVGVLGDRLCAFRVDGKIDEGGARLGVAGLFPKLAQFLVDSSDFDRQARLDGSLFDVRS